jgi:cysteinyl-tRNA synthetase
MYVCGITAYDLCHLGHARAAVVFDVVYRYLRHQGYEVEYIRNFTDIDDKIIKRSQEKKVDWKELAETYIQAFQDDMHGLGNQLPTQEPRATEFIIPMQEMIQKLIEKGIAYEVGGDVFYSVRKFKGYGKLSQKNIEDLESGARVEVNERKKDPLDFALWKAAKPGEPWWESPWGKGRPGWHIECSAMSTQLLGPTLDIHGGGRDLIFPHHENELAQSEGTFEKPFVKYWLHNGFVNLNADKMSKSTGNLLTIQEVRKKYPYEAIRYFLLSSQYRSPIDFTENYMEECLSAVDRFYQTLQRLAELPPVAKKSVSKTGEAIEIWKLLDDFNQRFEEVMDDDFNTASALALGFELVSHVNRFLDAKPKGEEIERLRKKIQLPLSLLSNCLGMFCRRHEEYFLQRKSLLLEKIGLNDSDIQEKITARKEARQSKNFQRADQIRNELSGLGILLEDRPDGTMVWVVK